MKQLNLFDENFKDVIKDTRKAIIGLDLSLRSTGYAIIDFKTGMLLDIGRIPTDASMSDTETFMHISGVIIDMCEKHNVGFGSRELTFVRYKNTAIRLSELGGSVVTTLLRIVNVHKYKGYPPGTIKKVITGKGNCLKEDVAWELQKTYPEMKEKYPFSTKELKKKNIDKTDDLYDALGCAVSLRMELLKMYQ